MGQDRKQLLKKIMKEKFDLSNENVHELQDYNFKFIIICNFLMSHKVRETLVNLK